MSPRAAVLALALLGCGERTAAIPPGAALVQLGDSSTVASASVSPPAPTPPRFRVRRVEQCVIPAVPPEDGGAIAVDLDVRYGPDERQVFDLAWPAGAYAGLVVIVHGGGWTAGAKKLFLPTIRQLASLGYVAATVNYRLARSEANAFPVGLADVRCAVREAQARVAERALDADRMVVLGASAGGHLAAMLAVDGDDPSVDGDCPRKGAIRVRGAIAYYAPLELDRAREHYPPKMVQAVDELLRVDAGAPEWDRRARLATPNHYVDPADSPVLLIAGSDDRIVPVGDSRTFARLLEASGVPALVIEVPGQDHGFPVFGRKDSLRAATCTALGFLEDALRARP